MIDWYIYLRLCWSEALNHLQIPISISEKAVLAAVFLKVFGITNYLIVGIVGALIVIAMFFLGNLTLKSGITARQTSLSNKYNPEIQKILNK